jgi:selenium metabolism protein YedF
MERIDLRGKTCPIPVIETKRLIDSKPVDEIEVLVDNTTSSENVQRFLTSSGFTIHCKEINDEYLIHGQKGSSVIKSPETGRKVLAFIDGETMGRGSDELGTVLIKSFLFTLNEITPAPWRIIFINAGVKLVSEDSPMLNILKDLEKTGVEIISCGTCIDYYRLKEKIGVGRVSNMFEIVSSLIEASNIIKP